MVEIFAVNAIDNIDEVTFNNILALLDKNKQTRIKRYINKNDASRSLLADILVRIVAIESLNINNAEIDFITNDYGKPTIKGFPDFYFNISHSQDWVVCAFDSNKVGIDIEYICPIDWKPIIRSFFSGEEVRYINTMDEGEGLLYFYDLWTLKESYIKAVGKGLSIPLDSFTIKKNDEGIQMTSQCCDDKYYFRQYSIDLDYKLSVCAKADSFADNVKIKSAVCLCNDFNMCR